MTESEKMKLGLWYDANYDQELLEEREKAEDLYFTFNHKYTFRDFISYILQE